MTALTPVRSAGTARPQFAPSIRAAGTEEMREIHAITRATVQAAIEVLAGTRPIHQLARRLDQRCLTALQHRVSLIRHEAARSPRRLGGLHRNPTVRSVRACEVTPDIYEASAVVIDELRTRAVAVRLERSKQVWRVTALEIG
ncbi:Rv3235 family protein [Arthrobacter sp. KBS0703]|uniref:Rv3235 family protein n=1 Tax=Arthrobacter sp. KBS0703 TaxID=1955698 RepID=UPI00099014C5|nr:Rv3235 family protein [Arthrobacter sp. KBS0703]